MRALAIMPVPMKPMLFDIVNVGLRTLERERYGIVEVVVGEEVMGAKLDTNSYVGICVARAPRGEMKE